MRKSAKAIHLSLLAILCLGGLLVSDALAAATMLKGIRFIENTTDTQVVLDLSGLPADLKVGNEPGKPMTITFGGKAAASLKPQVRKFSHPNLRQVYWESKRGKIQIFVNRVSASSTRYFPLENPNRLVVQLSNAGLPKPGVKTAAKGKAPARHVASRPAYKAVARPSRPEEIVPGLKHLRFAGQTGRGPILVNVLEVDPNNSSLEVLPALASDKMTGKAKVMDMVRKSRAIAGMNGSFFKPDIGLPIGTLIIDEELIAGPIFNRVALGIDRHNRVRMDRVGLRGEANFPNGATVRLDNVNQPRTKVEETVLYTPRWGWTAPKVPKNGLQVQLRAGKVTAISTTNPLPIPRDGYVLSGPVNAQWLAAVQPGPGETVNINLYTVPDWSDVKHAISGGPYLVKRGKVFVDTRAERINFKESGSYAPRSAAGITKDGKLLLVTVDGRQKKLSVGVSLQELPALMLRLGAVEAMNLDGGSSTQMVVAGRLVNSPSVAHGAPVSNSIVVRQSQSVITSRQGHYVNGSL